jgi:hypothetical protein
MRGEPLRGDATKIKQYFFPLVRGTSNFCRWYA